MRAVVQRVSRAGITIEGERIARIGRGYLVLLGIGCADTFDEAKRLWAKIASLRIMDDAAGKANLALGDVGGEVLLVSQFTLLADCRCGRRPSFSDAADPATARSLYERVIELARADVEHVETGSFGAHMAVELVNDGPFTIVLDTAELRAVG